MSGYEVSDDRGRLDRDVVHRYLSDESYWARGRAREETERAIDNSLCIGVYAEDGAQAGFARVITDSATFAWLCDLFVLPVHRGNGLGKQLVEAALGHPDLVTVRRWMLATADAHGLYRRYGFSEIDDRYMLADSAARAGGAQT